MAGKYSFGLKSASARRALPHKIIVGQHESETPAHVLLKLLGYLLFYREHIQLEPQLHDDSIPFQPDLVEFDYTLRIVLWVECGECAVQKLDRLAVKVPDAAIWVLQRSPAEADSLVAAMGKARLRRQRYRVIGFEAAMFDELETLLQRRNEVFWMTGGFDPPRLQFEFNGLWFDAPYEIREF